MDVVLFSDILSYCTGGVANVLACEHSDTVWRRIIMAWNTNFLVENTIDIKHITGPLEPNCNIQITHCFWKICAGKFSNACEKRCAGNFSNPWLVKKKVLGNSVMLGL